MVTLGSAGDVHPFLALGTALRLRGHAVTLATSGYFEDLVRSEGLGFARMGTREDFEEILANPDVWCPRRGIPLLVEKVIIPALPRAYELIENFDRRDTVVVASTLALGARVAQEKLDVPLATVHLQPYSFLSFEEPPVSPLFNLPRWLPRQLGGGVWRVIEGVADRLLGAEVNRFRSGLGLPSARRIFTGWGNSPLKVIGLFPEWFAPPAPDWPEQTVLTGFLFFDRGGEAPLAEEAEAFLGSGSPPVLITPGTAMAHAAEFFEAALEACRILDRRALLVTGHRGHLPSPLPGNALHVDYVPFSQVLQRCAAIVQHGGIGTTAQALAAGIPQLVQPMNFDQPDNAARLERLGVARSLDRREGSARTMADALGSLLGSGEVRKRCRSLAARIDPLRSLKRACRAVEELDGQAPPSPAHFLDRGLPGG